MEENIPGGKENTGKTEPEINIVTVTEQRSVQPEAPHLQKKSSPEVVAKAISFVLFALLVPLILIYLGYGFFNWHLDSTRAKKGYELIQKLIPYDKTSQLDTMPSKNYDLVQKQLNTVFTKAGLNPIRLSNFQVDTTLKAQTSYFRFRTIDGRTTIDSTIFGYSSLSRSRTSETLSRKIPLYWELGLDNYIIKGDFGTDTCMLLGYITLIVFLLAIMVVGCQQYYHYARQQLDKAIQADLDRKVKDGNDVSAVWEQAQGVLSRYYERNLSQNKLIFYVSVIVMICGFALILYGLSLTYAFKDGLNPATLSVGSGVIVQFIGATFLVIYNSTVAQSAQYTTSLQRVSTIGTSIRILDNITPQSSTNTDLIKSVTDAKIKIAQALIEQIGKV